MLLIYAEYIKFALFCMFFLILSEKNFEYYIFFDKFVFITLCFGKGPIAYTRKKDRPKAFLFSELIDKTEVFPAQISPFRVQRY